MSIARLLRLRSVKHCRAFPAMRPDCGLAFSADNVCLLQREMQKAILGHWDQELARTGGGIEQQPTHFRPDIRGRTQARHPGIEFHLLLQRLGVFHPQAGRDKEGL
jgi:hypothetical protein